MTTDPLKTFQVTLTIRAACEDDAAELLEDYTGQETYIEIKKIKKIKGE